MGKKICCATFVGLSLNRVSACAKHGMEKKRLAANAANGVQLDLWCDTVKFIYEQPLLYIIKRHKDTPPAPYEWRSFREKSIISVKLILVICIRISELQIVWILFFLCVNNINGATLQANGVLRRLF